ncbi:alkaline phosphatase family protein [Legionella jordanis]|nr:alkaline phosphatase family protein [Legionella jordanis]RMX04011.1 alkaline phosphatase family protein [Legionella jordanis]RMX22292.1 alkaline phosphatase family protein [Legionella jordanis]HAT8712860.1 alkaline phosphatase family protein [Legionella jordanis]
MKKTITAFFLLGSCLAFADVKPPKLVVQLVVDQLRGDLLSKYQKKFGENGFNYLIQHGIDYHNAHHPHANTVTCVGHATIATGSYPAYHGIVNNEWYDRKTKKLVACVEDEQSSILPHGKNSKTLVGRSPKNLIASTLSDEIVLAQTGKAFAVSLKDRSAITLAGHAGKAFWFDRENGGFVSSRHYYSSYPKWVDSWNASYVASDQTWELSYPKSSYAYAQAARFEHRFPGFGQIFPHHLGSPKSDTYLKYLSMTPMADEITTDFAISLLQHEQLGKSPQRTDYLAISFSAVDAIGHQFGPNSLESEDNLLRLDKTLARLLTALDEQVGLENTLIVLTADHGVSDAKVYLASHNIIESPSANPSQIKQVLENGLKKHFHLPAQTLEAISLPYIHLDHQLILDKQLSVSQVSNYLAELLRQQPGIFQAYPLPLASTEHDWLSSKVDKMAFPDRSGDLYVVAPPYQALRDDSDHRVGHGTPWRYDSYVPLLFANPKFTPQRIFRPVETTDIAPTLAAILLIKAPSAAVGKPLEEVNQQFENKT